MRTGLGLDHPLVTVRDQTRAVAAFERLGFAPTPVTFHPWGTWTSLIVMQRDLIELIGVHDPAAVQAEASGAGFAFGAYIEGFLEREEGVSLLALHSEDIEGDQERLTRAGIPITRRIDFRRAVTLPGDTPDEAHVSLLILYDQTLTGASQFVCQQHRSHCIWHPDWQSHPNGALGLSELVYVSEPGDPRLIERFSAMYGEASVHGEANDLGVETGNGVLRLMTGHAARARFGTLPNRRTYPAAVAIGVRVADIGVVADILATNHVSHRRLPNARLLVDPSAACNVLIEFGCSARPK